MKKILVLVLIVLSGVMTGCEKKNCDENEITNVIQLMYCENKSYIGEPYAELIVEDLYSLRIYLARDYNDEIVYYYELDNNSNDSKDLVIRGYTGNPIVNTELRPVFITIIAFDYKNQLNYLENNDYTDITEYGKLEYDSETYEDIVVEVDVNYVEYHESGMIRALTVTRRLDEILPKLTLKEYKKLD